MFKRESLSLFKFVGHFALPVVLLERQLVGLDGVQNERDPRIREATTHLDGRLMGVGLAL